MVKDLLKLAGYAIGVAVILFFFWAAFVLAGTFPY